MAILFAGHADPSGGRRGLHACSRVFFLLLFLSSILSACLRTPVTSVPNSEAKRNCHRIALQTPSFFSRLRHRSYCPSTRALRREGYPQGISLSPPKSTSRWRLLFLGVPACVGVSAAGQPGRTADRNPELDWSISSHLQSALLPLFCPSSSSFFFNSWHRPSGKIGLAGCWRDRCIFILAFAVLKSSTRNFAKVAKAPLVGPHRRSVSGLLSSHWAWGKKTSVCLPCIQDEFLFPSDPTSLDEPRLLSSVARSDLASSRRGLTQTIVPARLSERTPKKETPLSFLDAEAGSAAESGAPLRTERARVSRSLYCSFTLGSPPSSSPTRLRELASPPTSSSSLPSSGSSISRRTKGKVPFPLQRHQGCARYSIFSEGASHKHAFSWRRRGRRLLAYARPPPVFRYYHATAEKPSQEQPLAGYMVQHDCPE